MVKKLIVTLIGCLIPLTSIFAQTGKVTVTGVVIDEDSVPVAGAGIVLKGTTVGTFTDADGNFTLETDNVPDMTLEFSFIGMKTQEVKVSPRHGKAKLEIVMELDQNELDQVVVTGIFNRDLESYTGSVVTMKGEDIKKVSSTNIAKASRWGPTPTGCPTCVCEELPPSLEEQGRAAISCPCRENTTPIPTSLS